MEDLAENAIGLKAIESLHCDRGPGIPSSWTIMGTPRSSLESEYAPYWFLQVLNNGLRFSMLVVGLILFMSGGWIRAAEATLAWAQHYADVEPLLRTWTTKVVIDPWGDVIMSGIFDDGVHGKDLLTIKYSGTDGKRVWLHRYNGSANGDEQFGGLAVDSAGDVVVVGSSTIVTGHLEMYIAKYARMNGARIWERRINPGRSDPADLSTGGDAAAKAVAIGRSGNVFVTGNAASQGYTAKYSGTDGGVLWERWRPGAGGGALLVDEKENVIVRGLSTWFGGFGLPTQMGYLGAYASADGATVWDEFPMETTSLFSVLMAYNNGFGVFGDNGPIDVPFGSVFKFSAKDGHRLWSSNAGFTNGSPMAATLNATGDVFVVGYYDDQAGRTRAYVAKFESSTGAVDWNYRYDDPDHPGGALNSVALDRNGDVVVAGYFYSMTNSAFDLLLAKHASSDGTVRWKKYFDSSAHRDDIAFGLAVSSEGDPVVTGISNDESDNILGVGSHGNSRCLTLKVSGEDGATIWNAFDLPAPSSASGSVSVVVDQSGNPIVTGYSYDHFLNADLYTIKYDASTGLELWHQRFDKGEDKPVKMIMDLDGNVVVLGHSKVGFSWTIAVRYSVDDGRMLWLSQEIASEFPGPLSIAIDQNGEPIVASLHDQTSSIYKLSHTNGAAYWGQGHYPAFVASDQSGIPIGVAVGSNNSVIALVPALDAIGRQGFYLASYNTSSFEPAVWERTWYGPRQGKAAACAAATDPQGNIIVARSIETEPHAAESFTTKLSPSDGHTIWEASYAGNEEGDDVIAAIAVDRNGDIVVTGKSYNSKGNADYCTVKYASSNGALLWKTRYNGPAGGDDVAVAIAMDPNNDVVVTGYSYNEKGDADYYTACYSGAAGSLIWEKRYDGPAGGNDKPEGSSSLAIGPGGAVFVAGTSQISPLDTGGTEYAIVKYFGSPLIQRSESDLRIQFPSDPGRGYSVERAEQISGPWVPVTNLVAPMSGYLQFEEPIKQSVSAFYRLVSR